MVTLETQSYIPKILERLKEINPTKVIIFGSHGKGTATAESDLDLLVVTHHNKMPKNFREKEEIYLEVARLLRDIRSEISVDLVVHTRPMHSRFLEMNILLPKSWTERESSFLKGNMGNGKISHKDRETTIYRRQICLQSIQLKFRLKYFIPRG